MKSGNIFFCILAKGTYIFRRIFSDLLSIYTHILSVCIVYSLCITKMHTNTCKWVWFYVCLNYLHAWIYANCWPDPFLFLAGLVHLHYMDNALVSIMSIILLWPCRVLWPLVLGVRGDVNNPWPCVGTFYAEHLTAFARVLASVSLKFFTV